MDEFDWKMFKKPRQSVEIAIVNLVDVIFILLIFFIMTTTFSKETGVAVDKPTAKSASEVGKQNIMIAITREGTIHVNDRQVDQAALSDIIRRMIVETPDREAVLVADKKSVTGLLVQVMDACNLAGVKKISVAAMEN